MRSLCIEFRIGPILSYSGTLEIGTHHSNIFIPASERSISILANSAQLKQRNASFAIRIVSIDSHRDVVTQNGI